MGVPTGSTAGCGEGGPAFKLFPPLIQFTQTLEEGHPKPQTFTVTIQNLRSRTIAVRYAPPRSSAWKLLETQPVVHLASGLEHTFKVAFQEPERSEHEEQNEDKLDYHDRLKVMTSDCTVDLELHAMAPTAKLEVEGNLDFGIVTQESSAKRTLRVRNNGHKEAQFELECDVTGIETKITPESGTLAPGGSTEVELSCVFNDLGSFSGDLFLREGNSSEDNASKVRIGCTVIQQTFEVLEAGGAHMKQLKFDPVSFEDEAEYEIEVLNNGPAPVQWRGHVLTKSDHRVKLQYEEDQGHQEDGVDVGSYLMAARLRKSTSTNLPKAFSMSPESGLLPAFGTQRVKMRFHPHATVPQNGFTATSQPASSLSEMFEYIASFDLDIGKRAELPVTGRGVKAQVQVLPRADIDFGDLMTYEWADYPLNVASMAKDVPLNVSISRSSYFKVEPSSGLVPPSSALPVVATYRPKVMGNHSETLTVTVAALSGKVLATIPLYVRGTCSKIAPKPALVGGPDKLPEDFKREHNFIDPETANLSRLERQADLKYRRPAVWEKGMEVTNDDPTMSLTRSQKQQTVAHKDRYTALIRAPRTARAARHLTRPEGGEGDVNLGLQTTVRIKGSQPTAEPLAPMLYTPQTRMKSGSGRPRNRLPISASDVSLLQSYPLLPATADQVDECGRELTEGDIASLVVGPDVIDFGKISACSNNTINLAVTNHLRQHILFMVAAKSVNELDKTEATSVCLPPGKTAALPLVLNVPNVQNYKQTVDYVINGMHIYSLTVVADVVPVSLEPSKEHLNFQFDPAVWSGYVEQTVLFDNPNTFDAHFECRLGNEVFSVQPPSGMVRGRSSSEVVVRWSPDNDKPGTVVDVLEIVCVGGVPPHKKVHLRGELPEGKLSFGEKALDFGPMGLGTASTRTVTLRNAAPHDCIFQVVRGDEADGMTVSPTHGQVLGSDTLELEVSLRGRAEGAFSSAISVDVRGGKSIKLPVKGLISVPAIDVAEDEFDFGSAYLGATVKRPLTLTNSAAVSGDLRIDLAAMPEFTMDLPRAAWVGKHYDSCPLVEEVPPATKAAGFPQQSGHTYTITVAPKHTLKLSMVFRPTSVQEHAFELPLVMSGAGVVSELRRAVVADGKLPTVGIAPECSLDFGSQIVQSAGVKKVPTSLPLLLTSNVDEPVGWEFRAPSTDGQPNGKGVFRVVPGKGLLQPGVAQPINVEFLPRESKLYEGKIPLHINGADEPYLHLEVAGIGTQPRLTFDTPEVVLPSVPLGQRSEAVFYVVNGGYDNLELKFRLPPDGRRIPLEVELPEGDLIGIARDRLPVLVSFESDRPLSFTARLDFLDAEGKRYSILVSGATDNSVLTTGQFLAANVGGLSWAPEDDPAGPGPRLEEASYSLPPANGDAVGPLRLPPGLLSFLRAATNLTAANLAPEELPGAMAAGRGKGLVEMVEGLSGKPFPGKAGKLSASRKEAADQVAAMFDRLLSHLKSHGALLNAVKPHFLLPPADLRLWLLNREAESEAPSGAEADLGGEQAAALAYARQLLDDRDAFAELQARAYHAICQQVVKVYVVSRITPSSLKALPKPAEADALWPPSDPKAYATSNVYSPGEAVLLAWAGAHLAARFPEHAVRLRAFDEGMLRSGLPLLALMLNHWPPLEGQLSPGEASRLKKGPAAEEAAWPANAAIAARLWAALQLPFPLSAAQLLEASPADGLMLLAYAYQALPQLVPLTSIIFEGKLNEAQSKSIELSNPSRRIIAYNVRLEGSPEFSVTEAIVKLEPRSTLHFPVQVTPVSSHRSEAKLVLSSRAEGGSGAPAATLVFDLVSLPRARAPLERVITTARRYELKILQLKVANPFPSDTDLTVQLLPELAEPLPTPRPPSNEKGRRGGGKPKAKPTKEQAAKDKAAKEEAAVFKKFPDPFGCERTRMKLKFGQTDTLKIAYMPWTEGTSHCTVLLTSQAHGQFCYEITGEATPADTLMKVDFQVDIDGPQIRDLPLPYLNKQLEEAKRTFMERHPSAKKKDQTSLIPPGFQPLTPSGAPGQGGPPAVHYTVACNNPNVDVVTMDGHGLDLHDNPDLVWKDIAQRTGRAATPLAGLGDETPSGRDPGPNRLRLTLAPRGSGSYPVRLTLTSAYDTRSVLVTFIAQVRGRNSTLEFESPARASVMQEVPLVNNSNRPLEVRAKVVGGEAFSGQGAVTVPPKSTLPYELRFCAPWIGEYKGTLEMSIPSTGEMNVYSLMGRAGEPAAEGHMELECVARQSVARKLTVPNNGKGVARYRVYSDLDFVAGKETLSVESGRTREWAMSITPPRAGRFTGSITFATDQGPYVWFTLELTVSESAPVDRIEVTAAVRAAAAITVDVRNPLQEPTTFNVSYAGRDVLGVGELTVPASSTVEHVFYFMPLAEGVDLGRVQFEHQSLGVFWYELALTSTPSDPIKLPEMSAPVGSRATQLVSVPNAGATEVVFATSSSNPRNFGVSPEFVAVPPGGEATVVIEFSPSSLSAAATGLLRLDSADSGQWDYEVVGHGERPQPGEPLDIGASPGTPGTGQMVWRNPLDEMVTVRLAIEADCAGGADDVGSFSLMERRAASGMLVDTGEAVPVAVAFAPSMLRDYAARLVLSAEIPSQREPVRFEFPLRGLAETPSSGSVFKFSTKARSKLEAPLEVMLTGLSGMSPEEVFGFEVHPPAAERIAIERSLSIREVHTAITTPEEPLRYSVVFHPQKTMSCMVDLIITKKSGGRWRFEMQLEASQPDLDGELVIEAGVGQLGRLPLYLYAQGEQPVEFTAKLTTDSDLDLEVQPRSGLLFPRDEDSTWETSNKPPPLILTYRNKDYGKRARGKLIVQTPESEFTYLLTGIISKYVPPDPKSTVSRVSTKQDESLLRKSPKKKNFVAAAARNAHRK